MTSAEKEKIDMLFAKFMFACDIPFEVLDSPHFIAFMKATPDKETLTGSLLDEVYGNLLMNKQTETEDTGTLLINGNFETSRITAFFKPHSGDHKFIMSFETDGIKSESIISEVELTLKKCKALYNASCDSICVENLELIPLLKSNFTDKSVYCCKSNMIEKLKDIIIDMNICQQVHTALAQIFNFEGAISLLLYNIK